MNKEQALAAAPDTMTQDKFLRSFVMRGSQIMWFLGAGASQSAGVMTAREMILDFKRRIYDSRHKASNVELEKIQEYFDELGRFPIAGDEAEYSAYFEEAFPLAMDRRLYIEAALASARLSQGHLVLALLMRAGMNEITWTTNFDRLIEDGAARIYGGTGNLTTADLSNPAKFRDAIGGARWPLLGKLHGDFQSQRLKNTDPEFLHNEQEIHNTFVSQCLHRGLAVVGYSGRDASIMRALHEALDNHGFQNGLFWFNRRTDSLSPAVSALLTQARDRQIEAFQIDIDSFDDLMLDLATYLRTRPEGSQFPLRELETPRRWQKPAPARTRVPEPIQGVSGLIGGGLPQFRNDQFQKFCKTFDTRNFYAHRVLIFDVDRLTQINEYCGFETGNDILSAISVLLNQQLADKEFACRCGDDTFCWLSASAKSDSQVRSIDALSRIDDYPWQTLHPDLFVGCSSGTVLRGPREALDHAIIRAAIAMKAAKNRPSVQPALGRTVKSGKKRRVEAIKAANEQRRLGLLEQVRHGPATAMSYRFEDHWS